MPALLMSTSRRGSLLTLSTNVLMEGYDSMSSSQTSRILGPHLKEDSISSLALLPLDVLRQARITLLAPRATMCLAVSLPIPELAPVTMMVLEANEELGFGMLRNNWV